MHTFLFKVLGFCWEYFYTNQYRPPTAISQWPFMQIYREISLLLASQVTWLVADELCCVDLAERRGRGRRSCQCPSRTRTERHGRSPTTRSSTATCTATITTDAICVTMATTLITMETSSRRQPTTTVAVRARLRTRRTAAETATRWPSWPDWLDITCTSMRDHTASSWSTIRHRYHRAPCPPAYNIHMHNYSLSATGHPFFAMFLGVGVWRGKGPNRRCFSHSRKLRRARVRWV